jgi:hypothetical protein
MNRRLMAYPLVALAAATSAAVSRLADLNDPERYVLATGVLVLSVTSVLVWSERLIAQRGSARQRVFASTGGFLLSEHRERRWPPRSTSHPVHRRFGSVFLADAVILVVLALGALVVVALADPDALAIVALGLGVLALAGVVLSSVVGQHQAPASMAPPQAESLGEQPLEQDTLASAVALARQVRNGRRLEAEMRDAHEKGAWEDEGSAYWKLVEAWTEGTVAVLEECGWDDLARAVGEAEMPPRPPFEGPLQDHIPTYARLAGLLDSRIALLLEKLHG